MSDGIIVIVCPNSVQEGIKANGYVTRIQRHLKKNMIILQFLVQMNLKKLLHKQISKSQEKNWTVHVMRIHFILNREFSRG